MTRLLFLGLFLMIGCDAPKPNEEKKEEKKENESEVAGSVDQSGPYPVIKMPDGHQFHTGLVKGNKRQQELHGFGVEYISFNDCGQLPDEFDLRTLGVVPPIKNQGSCGSCWSFSKTASLESAVMGAGENFDLSEQELVSCDKEQYGCNGGFLSDFSYQIKLGQVEESDFPYTATDSRCKNNLPVPKARGVSFQYVGAPGRGPTAEELKCALYKFHTIPWITVAATGGWGSPPSNERTAYTRCSPAQTNHAVGVVGWWTDKNNKTQFIMRNSWGTEWGDKGYMSLPLGCNNFGEEAAFIQVKGGPLPPIPPDPPCDTPKVKLPAEIQIFAGDKTLIGVEEEKGVTYSWFVDDVEIKGEKKSMIYITAPKDAVYKIKGQNSCATAESKVRVRIVLSKP